MQLQSKHVGALAGLFFGWLLIQYGFIRTVFVLAIAAAGWAVGRVLDGEIDVTQYIRRRDDLE